MPAARSVDVFDYRDYRAFLRAYYEQGRRTGSAVSLRAFSRRAGLRSPNYLKLVMDGERNLTNEAAIRFAAAAGLRGQAAAYFCELVGLNQAKTVLERSHAHERLRRFPRYRRVHKLEAAQEAYHSQWYLPAVRELICHRDFRPDASWIARKLSPPISTRQAQRALDTLLELKLAVRDADGRVRQAQPLVETKDAPLGHQVASFHRMMMERASEALDRVPRPEREIASLTLCVGDAQLNEVKQRLERFREELLQLYGTTDQPTRLVQVNFQMFPLSSRED